MILLSTFLLCLFLTVALTPLFRGLALRLNAVDVPNERKVHTQPTPRTGGLAMALGALTPVLLWSPSSPFVRPVLAGAAVIVLFGFLDDFWDLDYRIKFLGQFLAAAIAVGWGGVEIRSLGALAPEGFLLPHWASMPLTVVAIVGVTNALNLSDGLDGLAGGIAALCFCCVGYLAIAGGRTGTAFLSVAVVGALVGFLRFNTHPASVFMGDAGSQFLGFLAITLSLAVTQGEALYSPLVPLLLLGVPVLDTVTVMAGRIAQGRSPFSADKNHFHHRLLRLGFSHAEAVLAVYALQALLTVAALALRFSSDWLLAALFVTVSGAVIWGMLAGERRGWRLDPESFFHRVVVGKLRGMRSRHILVRVAFQGLQLGVPGVLLVSCLLPVSIPRGYGLLAAALGALILASAFGGRSLRERTLRLAVYLLVPAVVYLGTSPAGTAGEHRFLPAYNAAVTALVFLAIIVLKFSRRQGFQGTTLDFLILAVALVVPNLQDVSRETGMLAARIIVLFYSYDVLVAELRGKLSWVYAGTVSALGITALRGLMG